VFHGIKILQLFH